MTNNTIKKLLPVVIIISFLTGLMSGCKYSNNFKDNDLVQTSELKEVTLTFYFPDQSANNPELVKVLDEIEKKTKDTLNANLDFRLIENKKYLEEIKTLITSGSTFEAFYANATFPDWVRELNKQNMILDDILLDITKMFPSCAPTLYSKFSDEELKEASYNGKIMAVPHYMPGCERMFVVARKDLLERYGISEIKTFDDYEAFLKTIKVNEKNIIPGGINRRTGDLFAEAFGYFVLDYQSDDYIVYKWDDPDLRLVPWEETEGFKYAYDALKRWTTNGYLSENDKVRPEQAMFNGQIASFIESWNNVQTAVQSISGKYQVTVFPLYIDRVSRKTPITGDSIIFNKKAKNPERALKFLDWVQSSQENYDLLMYGIEGIHYTADNNNLVSKGPPYYKWMGSKAFANMDYNRLDYITLSGSKKISKKDIEYNSRYPQTNGFIANYNAIRNQETIRENGFISMEDRMGKGIFSISVEDFIKEQKEAGVGIIIAELQKQLDIWKAQNNKE